MLTVQAKDPGLLQPRVEALLARHRLHAELRSTTDENLIYEVKVPLDKKVDRLSAGILRLDPEVVIGVEWAEKKEKK